MRINLRYVLALVGYWLRLYWWWMTSSSLLRFSIGYAVPIVALVLLGRLVSGNEGLPANYASLRGSLTPGAEVAGASATPSGTTTGAQTTTSPTAAAGILTYVVKSGDSLGAICSAQVPSMPFSDCVSAIVQINRLSGPDQIAVDQSLTLPAANSPNQRATTSPTSGAASPPASNLSVTPTSTPSVTSNASTTQGAPSPVKIDSVSSQVKPGQTASLSATVAPNVSCTLRYVAPAGTPGNPPSQMSKAADAAGKISWSWEIANDTKKGRGIVAIVCGQTSISAYVEVT